MAFLSHFTSEVRDTVSSICNKTASLVEVKEHALTFTELFVVSLQLLVLGREVDGILHSLQQHTSVSAL